MPSRLPPLNSQIGPMMTSGIQTTMSRRRPRRYSGWRGLLYIAPAMVLVTLFNAIRGRFAAHRKLARFTLPVWLYVSVTGVLVFVMLRSAF